MNDKVYELDQNMAKHIETLAVLYENFEQAFHDKKEAEDHIRQKILLLH